MEQIIIFFLFLLALLVAYIIGVIVIWIDKLFSGKIVPKPRSNKKRSNKVELIIQNRPGTSRTDLLTEEDSLDTVSQYPNYFE